MHPHATPSSTAAAAVDVSTQVPGDAADTPQRQQRKRGSARAQQGTSRGSSAEGMEAKEVKASSSDGGQGSEARAGRGPGRAFRRAGRSQVPQPQADREWPLLKVSKMQPVGAGAAFIKQKLKTQGKVMLVCGGDEALFQGLRLLRCARPMLIKEQGLVPVFQPVLLDKPSFGLTAGSFVFYTQKILAGAFGVPTVLRVSGSTEVTALASAIVSRIKEKQSCVLESFGKVPTVIALKAMALARRKLVAERLDVGVALDPVVVEVDAEDVGTTVMNRFVLLECAVRNPTQLRIEVNIRLRSPSGGSSYSAGGRAGSSRASSASSGVGPESS